MLGRDPGSAGRHIRVHGRPGDRRDALRRVGSRRCCRRRERRPDAGRVRLRRRVAHGRWCRSWLPVRVGGRCADRLGIEIRRRRDERERRYVTGSGTHGPSAVATATNSGSPSSMSTSHEAIRSDRRARELEDDLLAVERGRALPGERVALQGREVRDLDGGVDGGELSPAPSRGRSAAWPPVDAPVALEEDRQPARCHEAFAAAQLDGDERAVGGRDHRLRTRTPRRPGEDDGHDGSARGEAPGVPWPPDDSGRRPVPATAILAAMPVLRSRLDPNAPETRANHDAMAALVDDLRARQAAVAGRGAGGDERSIARHRERGKLPVRERIDRLLDPGSRLPRALPARRDRPLRRRGARRRDRHRHRPDRGHDLRDRRQRRDGQGRHLLPDDRQEAPARPGDRAREPAAVPLPRRQRRRVPAAPGRGLPRPRPLRPDLLQPGADVGRRRSRRSRWSWARARPAAPTSRR